MPTLQCDRRANSKLGRGGGRRSVSTGGTRAKPSPAQLVQLSGKDLAAASAQDCLTTFASLSRENNTHTLYALGELSPRRPRVGRSVVTQSSSAGFSGRAFALQPREGRSEGSQERERELLRCCSSTCSYLRCPYLPAALPVAWPAPALSCHLLLLLLLHHCLPESPSIPSALSANSQSAHGITYTHTTDVPSFARDKHARRLRSSP